jgi:TetR/AcrR family transcriptional regulator
MNDNSFYFFFLTWGILMNEKHLSRKVRERLRHRQEILNKALMLFTENGFHNVSMQQIADASEFAVGTLYNFFDSKEALFDELIRSCGERITNELTAILEGPGTEAERLIKFIRHGPVLLKKNAEIVKLYVSELGTRGAKISKNRDLPDSHIILNSRLERLLEDGICKGIFRRVDPAIATQAINSTIETLAFENASHFDKTTVTEMFIKVEQLFIEGLLLPRENENV